MVAHRGRTLITALAEEDLAEATVDHGTRVPEVAGAGLNTLTTEAIAEAEVEVEAMVVVTAAEEEATAAAEPEAKAGGKLPPSPLGWSWTVIHSYQALFNQCP